MKKALLILFFFSVALLSSFFASSGVQEINTTNVAEAAENPSQPNEGLVPCGRTLGPDMEPDPCTLCHFFVGFHNIITWGMKIMTFVAIFVIVIAGVTYIISAGNENIIGIAKKALWNVLIGFAIILGAWLIITTLFTVLSVSYDGLKQTSWNTFNCIPSAQVVMGPNRNENNDAAKTLSLQTCPSSARVSVGEEQQLKIYSKTGGSFSGCQDLTGATLTTITRFTMQSNNPSVATVDDVGVVTGVANGIATITATNKTDHTQSAAVVFVGAGEGVPENPTNGALQTCPSPVEISVGGTEQILVYSKQEGFFSGCDVRGADIVSAQEVTWQINNLSFATVSDAGVVTGVAKGIATVTATRKSDGLQSSTVISVK